MRLPRSLLLIATLPVCGLVSGCESSSKAQPAGVVGKAYPLQPEFTGAVLGPTGSPYQEQKGENTVSGVPQQARPLPAPKQIQPAAAPVPVPAPVELPNPPPGNEAQPAPEAPAGH